MKCMRKYFIQWASLGFLILCTQVSYAEAVFIDHCKHGCPTSESGSEVVVVRHLYASAIGEAGLPVWAAYRVFDATVGVASLFPRMWEEERLVSMTNLLPVPDGAQPGFTQPNLENSQDREYRVNEIRLVAEDRGRLTPMTSFASTPYLQELNLLSNMTPMPPDLRLGPWSRLDQAINESTREDGYYYVVSGPVFERDNRGEFVESIVGFFKVVARGDSVAGFLFPPQTKPHVSYCEYQLSLPEIEAKTSIDFFPSRDSAWDTNLAGRFGCSIDQ